jgi:branched-chain amino acid transport system substrate-binding protein
MSVGVRGCPWVSVGVRFCPLPPSPSDRVRFRASPALPATWSRDPDCRTPLNRARRFADCTKGRSRQALASACPDGGPAPTRIVHQMESPVRYALFGFASVLASLCVLAFAGDSEATSDRVAAAPLPPLRFGQSAPLSGPTADLGQGVRIGIEAAITEVNAAGGIGGRRLELISRDDGYEPPRTAVNVRELIEKEGVAAILGSVGAPCAVVAVPIAQESKTLVYGYVTGGAVLRKSPPDRHVVNFRAGLSEEADVLIDTFVGQGIRPEEIAFFTQRDAYGDTAFAGCLDALARHGLASPDRVRHVRYERNTIDIEAGLSELLLAEPPVRGVIFAGAGAPLVAFLRESHKADFQPKVGTFSFVDAMFVVRELGSEAEGLIVTQVVPPLGVESDAVRRYAEAMAESAPGTPHSFASFEGYLSARALFEAIRARPGDLSREAIVEAIRAVDGLDAGLGDGRLLRLRPDGHTICGFVWPTIVRGNAVVPIELAAERVATPVSQRADRVGAID